jgi:hypothetical protein
MAQQGKQMRVGAREGFAYHSVKLVLLAIGNRYEVDSNAFFLSGIALYAFKILPCPNSYLFLTHIRIGSRYRWHFFEPKNGYHLYLDPFHDIEFRMSLKGNVWSITGHQSTLPRVATHIKSPSRS